MFKLIRFFITNGWSNETLFSLTVVPPAKGKPTSEMEHPTCKKGVSTCEKRSSTCEREVNQRRESRFGK
jgi:hypothetical protein